MTKCITSRLIGCTALAAASALAFTAPALAQSNDDQPAGVRVNYADLNTNSAQGVAELKARVEAAAVQACGGDYNIRDLDRRAVVNQCRTQAVDGAMSKFAASQVAQAGYPVSGR
jgi:UrcA family protein